MSCYFWVYWVSTCWWGGVDKISQKLLSTYWYPLFYFEFSKYNRTTRVWCKNRKSPRRASPADNTVVSSYYTSWWQNPSHPVLVCRFTKEDRCKEPGDSFLKPARNAVAKTLRRLSCKRGQKQRYNYHCKEWWKTRSKKEYLYISSNMQATWQ